MNNKVVAKPKPTKKSASPKKKSTLPLYGRVQKKRHDYKTCYKFYEETKKRLGLYWSEPHWNGFPDCCGVGILSNIFTVIPRDERDAELCTVQELVALHTAKAVLSSRDTERAHVLMILNAPQERDLTVKALRQEGWKRIDSVINPNTSLRINTWRLTVDPYGDEDEYDWPF